MTSEHCPECKGYGREFYITSDGYERVTAKVCLNCKGSGIVEISDVELERRRLERERYEKEWEKREKEEAPRRDEENLNDAIRSGISWALSLGFVGFIVAAIVCNIMTDFYGLDDGTAMIFITIGIIGGIGLGWYAGYVETRREFLKRK